jgi:hypothetical protein
MSDGFGEQIPGGDQPRDESPGEAQVRLASWFKAVLKAFGVSLYPFEEEALAKVCGAIIRRWPRMGKWKAPKL